jgi:sensor c-di-GMP phosphodiesterase-like protein
MDELINASEARQQTELANQKLEELQEPKIKIYMVEIKKSIQKGYTYHTFYHYFTEYIKTRFRRAGYKITENRSYSDDFGTGSTTVSWKNPPKY